MKKTKLLSIACATMLFANSASAVLGGALFVAGKYVAGAYVVNLVLKSGKGFVEGVDNKRISNVSEKGKTFLSYAPKQAQKLFRTFGQTVKNSCQKTKKEWETFKAKRSKRDTK